MAAAWQLDFTSNREESTPDASAGQSAFRDDEGNRGSKRERILRKQGIFGAQACVVCLSAYFLEDLLLPRTPRP
jgi:hypothetical protein